MYIKQIIIQGFKSYKEQTEIERFSPGLNVIVGRNGSGKSNFFAAIRFVLSDAYTQMSREERQALLHEGSGSAVMSAYVEIIFDNSDERFPTGKPELVLRRTIGLNKDEYSLDRKNATRSDVMNLLESAGFSRSNPYYIVPQGRVTALTNMKDLERLLLLKEVAGTQVYEARRTESLKSMQNAENLQSKIDVLLDNVDERLGQLEEEKEELRKYQERDRESRCLQYTILNREQKEYNAAISKIDDQRTMGVEATDENRERLDQYDQEISELEHTMNEARQTHDLQALEKRQLDEERKDAQRDKAKLELEVQSLTAGQSSAQHAQAKHDQELQQVQQLIKEREHQLAKLLPQYNDARAQEQDIDLKVGEAEATQKRLFTKQGRTSQFKSKAERDAFLRGEINDVNVQLAQRKALSMQTNEEIVEMQETIKNLEQSIEDKKNRMDGRGDDLQNLAAELEKAKEHQEQLMDRRKELWRAESKLQSVLQAAQADLDNAQHSLQRLMDRNTWQGIQSVRRIQEEHGIEGVYGTLGELFEVSEANQTAVEVTGGTSLFNIVVDNDQTASKILDILNKEKGGRVTFMPLNRLQPKSMTMPNAPDAISMISRLKYDKKYDKAFQQVFGKAVICPNLQIASQYARSQGVSAITPQGDRADKKGSLTGGYHDNKKSRIKAIARENQLRRDLEDRKQELNSAKDELARLNQDITKAVGELQKMEQRRMQTDNSYGPLRQELRNQMGEVHRLRQTLENKQAKKKETSIEESRLAEEQSAYETELSSAFTKALSPQEERQLESLSSTLRDLRKTRQKHTETRSAIQEQKNAIEQELNENLRLRLDQLTSREFEGESGVGAGNASQQLKAQQRELKRAAKVLSDLEQRVAEAEAAVEQGTQHLMKLEQQQAEKQQSREELVRTIDRHKARMESNMRRKAEASKLLAECTRKIRDLGVLPEEAFKKYERWDSKKVSRPAILYDQTVD